LELVVATLEARLTWTQTAPELGDMYVAECGFPSKCHTTENFRVMASQERKIRLFLSHAFEDKESFVRGLAAELSRDFDVWYDEYSLRLGDRLLRIRLTNYTVDAPSGGAEVSIP
jgi:hypothetical protein